MTHRERIARILMSQNGASPDDWQECAEEADDMLRQLADAGLVIMPAVATNRMRHEACKGAVGITTGTFGLMWSHIVAYCRTLER